LSLPNVYNAVLREGPHDITPAQESQLFGRQDLDGFVHRSWLKSEGFSDHVFDGRPVIGIANSWSELTNCNAHLRQVADAVKRGVWSAGGFPLEFPTISLGEVLMKPTTMMFRNLMAMDVEECIRAYPLDAVVLLSGCDKTTPAMLMGAASADVPAVMVTGGPMLRGNWRQEELGSGTDGWRLWARAARRPPHRRGMERGGVVHVALARPLHGDGHRVHDGLDGGGARHGAARQRRHPAPDSRRLAMAELAGPPPVEMATAGGPKPSEDPDRAGVRQRDPHADGDRAARPTRSSTWWPSPAAPACRWRSRASTSSRARRRFCSTCARRQVPDGDFFYAGGLPVVLKALLPLLHGGAPTVNGRTLEDNVREAKCGTTTSSARSSCRWPRGRAGHPARQSLPRRRCHQGVGGVSGPAHAPRPRRGVRGPRRSAPAHRRSRAAGRRDLGAGAQARRPQGRARDARVGRRPVPPAC